jgi:hypothetical protein
MSQYPSHIYHLFCPPTNDQNVFIPFPLAGSEFSELYNDQNVILLNRRTKESHSCSPVHLGGLGEQSSPAGGTEGLFVVTITALRAPVSLKGPTHYSFVWRGSFMF